MSTRILIGPFVVPAELRDDLKRHGRETGAPDAEIVRRAIRAYLKDERKPRRPRAKK